MQSTAIAEKQLANKIKNSRHLFSFLSKQITLEDEVSVAYYDVMQTSLTTAGSQNYPELRPTFNSEHKICLNPK